MWPLFYLPWALTVQSPTLGLVGTTFFVVWHYMAKAAQMQKIELTIKSFPGKIQNYVTHKKESAAVKESGEGQGEVAEDDKGPEKRRLTTGPPPTQQKKVKKSPYVWTYAQWGDGQ